MITQNHGFISEYNSKNIECTTLFIRIRYTTLKCGTPLIYELENALYLQWGKRKFTWRRIMQILNSNYIFIITLMRVLIFCLFHLRRRINEHIYRVDLFLKNMTQKKYFLFWCINNHMLIIYFAIRTSCKPIMSKFMKRKFQKLHDYVI